MNGATFIVVVLISLAVLAAVLHMIRSAKSGKSLQCGGDCSACAMGNSKQNAVAGETMRPEEQKVSDPAEEKTKSNL